jgi:hypothetical protein
MFVNALQLYYNRHFKDMVHRGSTSKSPKKRVLPTPVYPPAKKSRKPSSAPSAPAAWSEAEVMPRNLVMLSNAACPMQKGRTSPNRMCHDMSHSKNGKKFIQRHTCKYCLAARINELLQKEHLHHWDAVDILMREFRRYFCGFCLLRAFRTKDFTGISLGKKCFNGHGAISSMRCCDHGREFKYCKVCKDPRAGGRFRACCGVHFTVKCGCEAVVPGEAPMAAAEVAEKDAWVEAALQRAQQMQAAGGIPPRKRVVVVMRSAAGAKSGLLAPVAAEEREGETVLMESAVAGLAAAVLEGLKKKTGVEFEEEEMMDSADESATTTTTPSASVFGSPSAAAASSSLDSTISIQSLVQLPDDLQVDDLPVSYETESDGEMWVVDDRIESDDA